jgi:hypothetical protein
MRLANISFENDQQTEAYMGIKFPKRAAEEFSRLWRKTKGAYNVKCF